MNIQNINSNNLQSLNTNNVQNLNNAQNVNTIENKSSVVTNIVPTHELPKNAHLSNNISSLIDNISKVDIVSKNISNQINTLDKLNTHINSLKNNNVSQNEIQPQIAKLISNYNTSAQDLNTHLSYKENLDSTSHSYFDGKAGSIPIDVELLSKTTSQNKEVLNNTLNQIKKTHDVFKQDVSTAITHETNVSNEQSPFKEIDFGKESADFTKTNLTNISGSVVSVQANATQTQATRLLN